MMSKAWGLCSKGFVLALCSVIFLNACGGGGGTSTSPNPAPEPAAPTVPDVPFEPAQRLTLEPIESVNTGGIYPLRVALPTNSTATQVYPVLYVFDAEWIFDDVVDAADALELELIVVGVENYTALTPTYQHREDYATWPLAESYFFFIRDELDPLITQQYQVDTDNKTMIGHSYLGLFTAFAYLIDDTENPFFHSYVSLDATVVGNSDDLLNRLDERFQANTVMNHQAIFVGAQQSNAQSVNWFALQVQDKGFSNLDIHYLSYDTSHKDVIVASLPDVLNIRYPAEQD
ncbi:MAG: hypothetical protein GJ680_02620 [Alteromonadaceae bacterium]|nr:hypothetical protein [Alteromonadaceae bacterium]